MKKKTEIAENMSSGAEKVERIEKENSKNSAVKTPSAKAEQKPAERKKAGAGTASNKKEGEKKPALQFKAKGEELAKKESEKAKRRVELALQKKQAKEEKAAQAKKRREAQKAERQKRREARKEAALKRKKQLQEELAALEQQLAKRREQRKEARLQRKAAKQEAKNEAKKERKPARQKRTKRARGERRNASYGGWLAAVIALGAVTLGLTAVVTVGAVDMAAMNRGMMAGHRGTMYEFVGVMENVDEDLDRVRLSNSAAQQDRILTDLLVQARIAEIDLEKLPIDGQADKNLTAFINKTARTAEAMLAKLRSGEKLSAEDIARLEALYQRAHTVRGDLDRLSADMTDGDVKNFLKGAKNRLTDTLETIENATIPENVQNFGEKIGNDMDKAKDKIGDKMQDLKDKIMPTYGENVSRTTPNEEEKGMKLAAEEAKERLRTYFTDFSVREVDFAGETISRGEPTYNFILTDKDGVQIFAQVAETDGRLVKFDYYKDCSTQNFDRENARRIAEEFLEKLGYEGMTAVRAFESLATADFLFVREDNGVLYYPQQIRVKVCEERGLVSGFDASKYMKNEGGRVEMNALISKEAAQEKLSDKLIVNYGTACVIEVKGRPVAAYEFTCNYDGNTYLVYINAKTGEEISIYNAENLGL